MIAGQLSLLSSVLGWVGTDDRCSCVQELKNLRPQLYSASEYCEKSYHHSEQKQMCETLLVSSCWNYSQQLSFSVTKIHEATIVYMLYYS